MQTKTAPGAASVKTSTRSDASPGKSISLPRHASQRVPWSRSASLSAPPGQRQLSFRAHPSGSSCYAPPSCLARGFLQVRRSSSPGVPPASRAAPAPRLPAGSAGESVCAGLVPPCQSRRARSGRPFAPDPRGTPLRLSRCSRPRSRRWHSNDNRQIGKAPLRMARRGKKRLLEGATLETKYRAWRPKMKTLAHDRPG